MLKMGKRHSRIAPKTLAELRDQTNFTVGEIQEWYKEFRITWPKEILTMKEFKTAYSTIFPIGDAAEFAEHVFRVFDLNGDGLLDFREFMCGFSVVLRGSVEEKLMFSFRIYDVDCNGFISRDEMKQVLSAVYNVADEINREDPADKTEKIFNQMDINGDDKLSLDEFINGIKKNSHIVKMFNSE